jgi:O-antigen/teichoic acid export membrane protein
LRSIGSALGSRIGSTLVGVVTFGILARSLGSDGLGTYRTTLTLLLFAGVSVDLGLYSITLRDISQPGADKGRTLGNAVALRVLATAAATGLLALALACWGTASASWSGVAIAAIGWVAYQTNELLRAVFQYRMRQSLAALAEMAGAVVTLVLVSLLARWHAGVNWMLAASATGFCCMGSLAWVFAKRLVPFQPRIDSTQWRRLALAGLPLAASTILLTVHLRIDVLFLSFLRPVAEVGLYDPPLKIYELLSTLPYLFGGLLLPLFVRDLSVMGSIARRLSAAAGVTILFASVAFVVLFQCAEPVLGLLAGDAFVSSATPLRILAASAAFAGLTAVFRFAAVALDQQARVLRADIFGVSIAIVCHIVLIPKHGLVGAAIGKLVGDVATLIPVVLILRRHLNRGVAISVGVAAILGGALLELLDRASVAGVHWLVAVVICVAVTTGVVLLIPAVRRRLADITFAPPSEFTYGLLTARARRGS